MRFSVSFTVITLVVSSFAAVLPVDHQSRSIVVTRGGKDKDPTSDAGSKSSNTLETSGTSHTSSENVQVAVTAITELLKDKDKPTTAKEIIALYHFMVDRQGTEVFKTPK